MRHKYHVIRYRGCEYTKREKKTCIDTHRSRNVVKPSKKGAYSMVILRFNELSRQIYKHIQISQSNEHFVASKQITPF